MNMETNNELGELRSQITLLRDALNNEKLVNTRLMRSVMGTKMKPIMRQHVISLVVCAIMLPYCGYIFTRLTDNSLAFIIVTELFFIIAMVYDWYIHRGISVKAIVNGNLVDTGRRLARLKRLTVQWQKYAIPFVCLWLVWFLLENEQFLNNPWGLAGFSLGIVCGAAAGIYQWRKKRRTIDELLRQIDELTNPE